MDRARLDAWLEKGILGLVILILGVGPIYYGSTTAGAIILHEGLVSVALCLWALRIWVRKDSRILLPPFSWAVLVFVGYAIWHLNNTDLKYLARWDIRLVFVYAALYFLIVDNLNRQEWTQLLAYTVVFTGMAIAMYALYQYIGRSRWVLTTPQYAIYFGRASGTYICPNHLASYMGLAMPVAFALTLMARINSTLKIVVCYAGIMMLGGLIVTFSRAGIAASVFALLALFAMLITKRDFRIPAIAALVLILAPGIWFAAKNPTLQSRIAKASAAKETPIDDRLYIWPAAVQIWREHFWTGAGPNHYDTLFRPFRPELAQMQAAPARTHNDYLNTLCDWGYIGFSLITVALGVFLLSLLRIWRFVRRSNDFGSKQSTRAAIVFGCSIGVLALLLQLFFEFSMHIPSLAMLVVTWLAVVTGHWRYATERFWVRGGIAGRLVASAAVIGAVIWFVPDTIRFGTEQSYLRQQARADLTDDQRLDLRKKAFAADPENADNANEIGELLREKAWTGLGNYTAIAEEAIKWFDISIKLNPFDSHAYVGKGMCLHWIGKHEEAFPYFREAVRLDPNSYWTRAMYGWHFVQIRAWGPAAKWFRASWNILSNPNPIVKAYWPMVERFVKEEGLPPELSRPLPEPDPKAPSDNQ